MKRKSLSGLRAGTLAFVLGFFQLAFSQMVDGTNIPEFGETFQVNVKQEKAPYSAGVIKSSVPANILWPKDKLTLTFQIKNQLGKPIKLSGKIQIIEYGTQGRPGDVWVPRMFKIADVGSVPLEVDIPSGGFKDFTISPVIPAKMGAYGLVVDLDTLGRQFLISCCRTFAANPERLQYPVMSLDDIGSEVLGRLGIQAIRFGIEYKPTTDPDFEQWFKAVGAQLEDYAKNNVTVLFMPCGGPYFGPTQPLLRPRPWLDKDGFMQETKTDLAWLPEYDADFQKYCKLFASKYGWPRGPITAFSLWNEPWEGISISGWGADMLRYREMFLAMARAIHEVNKTGSVKVLVGGGDSHSNALDKFFPDGSDSLLKYFDFVSLHYQGINSPSTFKPWLNRKSPNGRVKNWDTESWVANVDDRVAAIIAVSRACGYDRTLGVYGGNIRGVSEFTMSLADGTSKRVSSINAWSVAPSVGAARHFLGERSFKELLFKNGLPWVMVFNGNKNAKGTINPDDGTVVVVGDLADVCGADNLLFRTVRGLKEIANKAKIKKQIVARGSATGTPTTKLRDSLETVLASSEILSGATMTIAASDTLFHLYDFYGNPVETKNKQIVIPLDGRGFFLRTDGSAGSFAKLTAALAAARIEGIEPLATVCHDLTARIETKPILRLSLTNVLNRPVTGKLAVTLGHLKLDNPTQTIAFKGNETIEVLVKVIEGTSEANNSYPLSLEFDAGSDGKAVHAENMHVNVVAKKSVVVDGKLDEWSDVPPQTIVVDAKAAPSLTEAAWFPFKKFDASVKKGFSNGYLAYDKDNFYFAAKVADNTPDQGSWRFESRNDDDFFYPETSYAKVSPDPATGRKPTVDTLVWPAKIRRYSYRKENELPSGNFPNFDNIQIAFNVLPQSAKKWELNPPGTMPGFIPYQTTDYEYALNPVAPQYGGGTEIWRLEYPGMPHKHFYARQPKSPLEGPVKTGKLVVVRDATTRSVEASIPWSELPDVNKKLDAGETIKFSYRVNDNSGGGIMELAYKRSVSKRGMAFHVDWMEHWDTEVEFAFEK